MWGKVGLTQAVYVAQVLERLCVIACHQASCLIYRKEFSNVDVDRSIGTKREEKKEKKKAGEIFYKLPG